MTFIINPRLIIDKPDSWQKELCDFTAKLYCVVINKSKKYTIFVMIHSPTKAKEYFAGARHNENNINMDTKFDDNPGLEHTKWYRIDEKTGRYTLVDLNKK